MNLEVLLGLYENDHRVKKITQGILRAPDSKFYLKGLQGSSLAFILAPIRKALNYTHVIVMNDREEAAYFHNDVEHLTQALDICYFPDSFKRSGNFHELNSSHVMLRTEALMKFQRSDSASAAHGRTVLVTYPEALFEKVVRPNALGKNIVRIKVGEALQTDALMEKLVELGFKREEFVYEPGQFAMRGGIFDIYSFGNEHPYRIELFGDDVDSIRLFNPETQLSERKLLNVNIVPNIETNFDIEERISLFDYLPQGKTVYWFKDLDFALRRLGKMETDLPEALAKKSVTLNYEDHIIAELKPEHFDTSKNWNSALRDLPVAEFYNQSITKVLDKEPDENLEFSTTAQPVFNRQFELLIKDFKIRQKFQTAIFIFAENPRQLERLRSIFEDLNAEIEFYPIPVAISQGFVDLDKNLVCFTDHQIFQRYHKFKVKQAYSKGQAITMRILKELQPGDFVTHIDHGVGTYSGLQKIEVNGAMQEAVRILYKDNDVLYVNINSLHKIGKYSGKEGHQPKLNKLGSDAWDKLKNKTKKQVKDIASDLIKLYAKRKASQGFGFSKDSYLQTELEASFIYEDTPDQSKSTADIKRDMESPSPMDRLVCGDVGFGKTELAIRAAFKAVCDSKQVAVLVPTTVLAFQHHRTFSERLKDFPANVALVNRFKTAKEKKEIYKALAEGKIDILIGTHAILGKDVKFKDLGLLIIDEEQKFGVAAKEKLRTFKANVDTLTLTATPIPRTLQFSLMNARDLSIMNTAPPNRQPVHTELMTFDEIAIREAIYFEVERGGQVFFIHNRVQSLPDMGNLLKKLCPDLNIGLAHGQMEGRMLENALMNFIERQYDVLCCTNIVESGVDIPNANTIIINNAHQFGLSDLHQLRGRVGRSNKKAFCYLVSPGLITLPDDSRKRLQTLEQFSDLGSGFQIAMRDLDIRGAGNLLGGEQSGFIAEIGFDMYQKILAEAIRELKATDFKDLFKEELERQNDFVNDCTIDTDLEILIPEPYISDVTERLSIYTQLDNTTSEQELEKLQRALLDRFGPLPDEVNDLFTTVRCRRLAIELGFEKLILKNKKLRLYFLPDPESSYFESQVFQSLLHYVQTKTNKAQLKHLGKNFYLSVEGITGMKNAFDLLDAMHKHSLDFSN